MRKLLTLLIVALGISLTATSKSNAQGTLRAVMRWFGGAEDGPYEEGA
jgi:hypothetical protein